MSDDAITDQNAAPPREVWPLLVAAVLLAAAGLKAAGDAGMPPPVDWLILPWARNLIIAAEIGLAVWLASGRARPLAWLAAVGAFAAFAFVSGRAAWLGQASCDCFGKVPTDPRWVFLFDLSVLIGLCAVHPSPSDFRRAVRSAVKPAGALVGIAAAGVASLTWSDQATALRRLLTGEQLALDSPSVDLGRRESGKSVVESFPIRNISLQPIRIVGGTADCSSQILGTPRTISPGETQSFEIKMKVPAALKGRAQRVVELWTDSAAQPRVRLIVTVESGPQG